MKERERKKVAERHGEKRGETEKRVRIWGKER